MQIEQLNAAFGEHSATGPSPKQGLLRALTQIAGENPTPAVAWRRALELIAAHFQSALACLYVRIDGAVVDEEVHRGPSDPAFWRGPLREFYSDCIATGAPRARSYTARNAALRVAFIGAPIADRQGGSPGALALVIRLHGTELEARLAELEAAASVAASLFLPLSDERPAARAAPAQPNQALARAATASTAVELAFTLTNSLRNKLGCEQVALGFLRQGEVEILSISGIDEVKRSSPGVIALRAAMAEAADFKKPIVYQDDNAWDGVNLTSGHLLHKRWHETAGKAAVASIPLQANGRTVSVISIRYRSGEQITKERLNEVHAMVGPFAPALGLLRTAQRSLIEHFADSLHAVGQATWAPGRPGRKVLAAAAVLFSVWFCFFTTDYRVRVPGKVVAARVRHIAMPFEGRIATVQRNVGDMVHTGDVLCTLVTHELELQRAELEAQRMMYEQQQAAALASDKPVDARLAEANARLMRARLELLEARITKAEIRAPFDGVLVSGDLRPLVDATLPQGEPLYEIAPMDQRRLELHVPDHAAANLRNGLRGQFVSEARPESPQGFELTRLRPRAEIVDGQNVFVLEADARLGGDFLRPGMEGTAQIEVGRRQVWWVALHGVVDYLRLNFWL